MKTTINLFILLCFVYSITGQTIYLEESFDNCELPTGWKTEEESTSKGWTVTNSSAISTELLPYPENDGNCFIGNSDIKWDDSSGNLNNAISDKLILPFLDLSESENLVLSFDYVTGYKSGVKLYFRTENSEWEAIGNAYLAGGILEWQHLNAHIYGHVNAPIKNVGEPIQFMFEFNDYGFSQFLGVGLDNIKIYEAPDHDLILKDVHLPSVVPVGLFPLKPGFKNHGSELIDDIEIEWQIDNGPIQSQLVTNFAISHDFSIFTMVPFGIGTVPSPDLLVNFEEEGLHTFKMWAKSANNQIDINLDNNYWEGQVYVKNELPVKQYIYEKFSHHTCAPCYNSDLLASEIAKENKNIHIVSVHSASSDPMDYPLADVIDIAYSQRTHPGTILDRRFMDMYDNGKMSSLYEFLPVLTTPWYSPVNISFVSKEINQNQITLEVQAEFIIPVEGEYRFNIWTIENGIVNYQAGSPEGNDYVHNHVLRNYSGGNYGAEDSLPIEIEENKTYNYTTTIDIDPSWNIDSLEFIAIIQEYTADSDDRSIINASKISVADPIILADHTEEILDFTIYPNPSSQFIHIVLDEQTDTDFELSIYNLKGELVKHDLFKNFAQNYIQYDIRTFASGNYLVVIESNKGKKVKQFSVVK